MTDRFLKGVTDVLKHEGGYNDIKEDAGGVTQWGVSLAFLKAMGKKGDINGDGKVNWLDVKELTKDEAIEIYWDNFWRPLYDKLQSRVGVKVFDTAVNAGHSRAHKLLQTALVALGENVAVDGVIGKQTISAALNQDEKELLTAYSKAQAAFYQGLVAKKPSQKKFIKGWLNRAAWLPK